MVEVQPLQVDAKNQSIGIDLGIKIFAVMSDGSKAESPNYSKQERKIRKLQKRLARQQKNSNRRNKTRIPIAQQPYQLTPLITLLRAECRLLHPLHEEL